jgi:hypothetical protein
MSQKIAEDKNKLFFKQQVKIYPFTKILKLQNTIPQFSITNFS